MAHRWWFEFFSKERELPLTTLLALSRQESAFYTHAVSPVGARGLMQLMPATAKETSKKLGFRYLGASTLSDPGINIRLGSGYLKMLLDQFDDNRILAFAATTPGLTGQHAGWKKPMANSMRLLSLKPSRLTKLAATCKTC